VYRYLSILLGMIGIAAFSTPVEAENLLQSQAEAYRELLAQHVRVQTPSPERLEESRKRLLQATSDFESYLSRGKRDHADGWKSYLRWTSMQHTLNTPTPNLSVLNTSLQKYYCDTKGLEQPAFMSVRAALDDYVTKLRYASPEDPVGHTVFSIDELAMRLARYDLAPSREDAHAIGRDLTFLEVSESAPPALVNSLRQRFDRPNGYFRVNNSMVSMMLKREVKDTRPFSRTDGAVTTRGKAHTDGHVFMELSPYEEGAAFLVRLMGTVRSPDIVSQQRNITVRSSCVTEIDVRKRVKFTDAGFTYESAQANADSTIQIKDVSARGTLIERLAEGRAERQKSEYEQQSSQIARREITGQIDDEVSKAMKEANHVYIDFFRNPLMRVGTFPKKMDFYSTREHVGATIHLTSQGRLGSVGEPPELDTEFDIAGALHESLIDNYCNKGLSGALVLDKGWAKIMNILTGTEPRALWVHDRTDPWSFTFHDERPLEVDFRDGLMTLTLRSREATRASNHWKRSLLVRASYRIAIEGKDATLYREGPVVTQLDDGLDETAEDAKMVKFLARKFGGVFQPELHFDGLVPPAGGSLGKLRQIELRKAEPEQGWLNVGFRLVPDPQAARLK